MRNRWRQEWERFVEFQTESQWIIAEVDKSGNNIDAIPFSKELQQAAEEFGGQFEMEKYPVFQTRVEAMAFVLWLTRRSG